MLDFARDPAHAAERGAEGNRGEHDRGVAGAVGMMKVSRRRIAPWEYPALGT
jgi:hypothetical protein